MRLLLMGGGKFAGYIYSKFKSQHHFVGYLDDLYDIAYIEKHYGLRKLGTTQDIEKVKKLCSSVCITVGSEGDIKPRVRLYETFFEAGFDFPILIHSSVTTFGARNIGVGTIIEENVNIGPMTSIGNNCRIGPNVFISHDVVIGDNVFMSPGVILNGSCQIKSNTFLGSGAIIIQKKCVGNNCVIGAGSCVITDIPDNSIAVGVPAKVIKSNP